MGQSLHSDHERVRAALQRDPDAIEWLCARLALVPRMIARLTRRHGYLPAAELADIAQDAVVVALRRLADYHGLAPFDAWLHVICLQTLRSQLRRRWRDAAPLEIEPPDPESDPADRAADAEDLTKVRAAIEAIGGVEAELLRLRFVRGLDLRDMAALQGIPLATMRTRYYRAMKKLEQRLNPPDAGADSEAYD